MRQLQIRAANGWKTDGAGVSGFAGGLGTKNDPYLISSEQELAYLGIVLEKAEHAEFKQYEGKYYQLTKDLDLQNREWTPIGRYDTPAGLFFDGKNHQIKGLVITESAKDQEDAAYQGLFGSLRGKSSIQNLRITDASVSGSQYVGAVAGHLCGSLENCHVSGTVKLNQMGNYLGGLVGFMEGENGQSSVVKNCSSQGTVKGSYSVLLGGIAGAGNWVDFINCKNQAVVTGGTSYVGGIVGKCQRGTIRQCINTAALTSLNEYVGGIAGGGSVFEQCFNSGTITISAQSTSGSYAGGITGHGEAVMHSINTGTVEGLRYIGGIAGMIIAGLSGVDSKIQNCYNNGMVTGGKSVGGIAGSSMVLLLFQINGCYSGGTVTGQAFGGIMGEAYGGVVTVRNTHYLSGSAARGIGSNNVYCKESRVTATEPKEVPELLLETERVLKATMAKEDKSGKDILNEILSVVYQLLEFFGIVVEGSGQPDYGVTYTLDEDEKLFISVIAAESIGQGQLAWEVVANVIMNRVGQREWTSLTTPRAVMEQQGQFSCLNNGGSTEYHKTVNYLANRVDDNNIYEQLIAVVMPVYHGDVIDITGGAQLYYSPMSMIPAGTAPWWASSYKQITVAGINSNEFVLFTGERIQ